MPEIVEAPSVARLGRCQYIESNHPSRDNVVAIESKESLQDKLRRRPYEYQSDSSTYILMVG